jgi:hypothetical protein
MNIEVRWETTGAEEWHDLSYTLQAHSDRCVPKGGKWQMVASEASAIV